jgi:hypothetical protein
VTVTAAPDVCSLCGATLAPDQEWCLECGAARTVVAQPPDWRLPLLVIGAVVALVAAGAVIAMISLSRGAGHVTVISTPAARAAGTVPDWPAGLDGYTVLLSDSPSRGTAQADATLAAADHVPDVGLVSTDQHPLMRPRGVFYVYSGRYPTYATAQAAQARLVRAGQAHADVALVQRPGGA